MNIYSYPGFRAGLSLRNPRPGSSISGCVGRAAGRGQTAEAFLERGDILLARFSGEQRVDQEMPPVSDDARTKGLVLVRAELDQGVASSEAPSVPGASARTRCSPSRRRTTIIERRLMKPVLEGAVIVARGRLSKLVRKGERKAREIFPKTPDLILRLNLFEVRYANSESLLLKQRKLAAQLSARQYALLTFTRGLNETTIVASRDLRVKILREFQGEKMISQTSRLAAVTVILPKGAAFVPGVYSYLLKALAREGINVVEVVSTLNEFTIILEDRNIDAAFSILKKLFKAFATHRL